jgi:hypothetical protein
MRLRAEGRERDVNVFVGRRPPFPEKECEPAGGFAFLAPLFARSRAPEVPASIRVRPMQQVETLLPQLFGTAQVRFMVSGATFRTLDPDARDVVRVEGDGVLVDQVTSGTPADVAGLRSFDVVTRVNGQVVRTPFDLRRVSGEERTLVLTVVRGGEARTVTLVRER